MAATHREETLVASPGERLETWKQIAAYLGRDERTAKRWETQRGLPVRRPPGDGRSTVYAYAGELEAWRRSGPVGDDVAPEAEFAEPEPESSPEPPSGSVEPAPRDRSPAPVEPNPRAGRRQAAWIAGALVVLALAILAIVPRLTPARGRARAADLSAAREDYARGLYAWQTRTPEGLNQAVDSFTQAIVKDPGYAPAYVGLADCYNLLREYTLMPPAEAYARAKAAAQRALALDDGLAGAHRSLAFVDFWGSRDIAGARREFARALALDPRSAQTHHWYATFLLAAGEPDRALTEIDQASQLDPSSRAIMADRGLIMDSGGRRQDAVRLLTLVEAMEPRFLSPHDYLASIYLDEGADADYLREVKQAASIRNDAARSAGAAAAARGLATGGRPGMLMAIVAEQQRQLDGGAAVGYPLAKNYARLGDRRRALAALKTAVTRAEPGVLNLAGEPAFRTLRGDPEFQRLEAQAGRLRQG